MKRLLFLYTVSHLNSLSAWFVDHWIINYVFSCHSRSFDACEEPLLMSPDMKAKPRALSGKWTSVFNHSAVTAALVHFDGCIFVLEAFYCGIHCIIWNKCPNWGCFLTIYILENVTNIIVPEIMWCDSCLVRLFVRYNKSMSLFGYCKTHSKCISTNVLSWNIHLCFSHKKTMRFFSTVFSLSLKSSPA